MVDTSVDEQKPGTVKVVGIEIPFMDMVVLLVKFALATIPALLLLGFIAMLLPSFLSGFMSGIR